MSSVVIFCHLMSNCCPSRCNAFLKWSPYYSFLAFPQHLLFLFHRVVSLSFSFSLFPFCISLRAISFLPSPHFLQSIISRRKRQACFSGWSGGAQSQSIKWCFEMGAVGCRHTWELADCECGMQRDRSKEWGRDKTHTAVQMRSHSFLSLYADRQKYAIQIIICNGLKS